MMNMRLKPTPLSSLLIASGLLAACLPVLAQTVAAAPGAAASAPVAVAAAAPDAAASATPPAKVSASELQMQEVTVTAQKIAQPASKTPLALSVLGGEELKSAGIVNARELTQSTPNVQIAQQSGMLEIAIRGVVSLDVTEKGDSSAAFNIDGANISRPEAQTGAFFDLDRVEVLRGPQGTLYGRNATAGAINLITNKPAPTFGASVGLELGNYNTRRFDAMINTPLSDGIAIRMAVTGTKRDSYLHAGPNGDVPLESQDDFAGRVSLLDKFTPDTSLLLTAETTHTGGGGASPVPITNFFHGTLIGTLPFSPPGTGNDVQNPVYYNAGTTAQRTTSLSFGTDPDAHRDNNSDSLRGEFKTNLGWADLTYQMAGLRSSLNDKDSGSYFGFPLEGNVKGTSHSLSNELRLNSNGTGPLRWVAGLYEFHEIITRDTSYDTFVTAPFGSFIVDVPYLPHVTNKSMAAFGQVTYSLLDDTRLTVGLRETRDEKAGYDPLGGVPPPTGSDVSTGAYQTDVKFHNTSWKIGLDHDLSKNSMLYASVATGYKAGGFNDQAGAAPYKPENLTAYEAGIKGRFLDGTLQLSTGVFHYNYRDLQLTSVVCPTNDPTSCGSLTTNAANAKTTGFEFEGKMSLGQNDTIDASLALTNARFKSYKPNATDDWSGQRLDLAPADVLSLGYNHAFEMDNGSEFIAAVGTRLSSSYTISDPAAGVRYAQPSFHKSDASVSYNNASGKLNVQLFVKNIENRTTIESMVPGGFFLGDPRTYGIRTSYRF